MLNICFVRTILERLAPVPPHTPIINGVNPGCCHSELRQNFGSILVIMDWMVVKVFAYTTEKGSRKLVWAAIGRARRHLATLIFLPLGWEEPSNILLDERGREYQNKVRVRVCLPKIRF
jgi:retinol dehydrogenase 12